MSTRTETPEEIAERIFQEAFEAGRLAAFQSTEKERDALKQQLAEAQKQFGLCSNCNSNAWRNTGTPDLEQCEVCLLREQLARAVELLGESASQLDSIPYSSLGFSPYRRLARKAKDFLASLETAKPQS